MNNIIDETACITLAQLRHQKGRGKTEKPKNDSETATESCFYLAILVKYLYTSWLGTCFEPSPDLGTATVPS